MIRPYSRALQVNTSLFNDFINLRVDQIVQGCGHYDLEMKVYVAAKEAYVAALQDSVAEFAVLLMEVQDENQGGFDG